MQIAQEFYTLTQAAVLLGVNRITVRRWIQARKLTGQRVGRMMFIEKHQVDALKAGPSVGLVVNTK